MVNFNNDRDKYKKYQQVSVRYNRSIDLASCDLQLDFILSITVFRDEQGRGARRFGVRVPQTVVLVRFRHAFVRKRAKSAVQHRNGTQRH